MDWKENVPYLLGLKNLIKSILISRSQEPIKFNQSWIHCFLYAFIITEKLCSLLGLLPLSTSPKQAAERKHGQPGSQHHGKNMYPRSKEGGNWMRATACAVLTPLDFCNDWLLYTRGFSVHPAPTCPNKTTHYITSRAESSPGLHHLQCKCLPIHVTLSSQILKKINNATSDILSLKSRNNSNGK